MEKEVWSSAGWAVGLVALVTMLLRQVGPWRKQISDSEQTLRTELHFQIDQLKDEMQRERLEHSTEMRAFNHERDDMGDRLFRMERQMLRQESRHRAEIALHRHKFKNITQCFDAMLLLLELSPEKGPEIVTKIKEMRSTQMLAEAEEMAIIQASEIRDSDEQAEEA